MIRLTTYADARDAFRSRALRQALYDEGEHLMAGVVVNLHGDAHVARRRLENRLFRPDVFAWYERERIPAIVAPIVAAARAAGLADLLPLARLTMLTLSSEVAGVDRAPDADLDHLHDLAQRLARASTVTHATGDKAAIVADGDDALRSFEARFYAPSFTRRCAAPTGDDLPDVLTTLLRNRDGLHLPDDVVLRETAYYTWVGAHSTANAFVHAMHHVFEWQRDAPLAHDVLTDPLVLRRFVHESLRLHPASPVAQRVATTDVELRAGLTIAAGEDVVVDVQAANRDASAVGADPERFDPWRRTAEGVPPWGLSFGHGPHSCLGRELAGGRADGDDGEPLVGAIVVMAAVVLASGAAPDPDDPPTLDEATTRRVWGRYPVRFGGPA